MLSEGQMSIAFRLSRISLATTLALSFVPTGGNARAAAPPRVLVNEVGFASQPFSDAAQWAPAGRRHIADLAAEGPAGPLVALTDGMAYWVGSDGRVERSLRLPKRLGWPTILPRVGPGWWFAGATDSVGRRLSLNSDDGAPPVEVRLGGFDAEFANVLGDATLEIVARASRTLLVYDIKGVLLRRIHTHDYVDDFWPVDVDGSGTAEFVVYHYVSQKEGTYISVVDAEGERLRTWHEPRANRYLICRWRSPSPELIASRDDAFTVRNTHGEILKRYVVPGAGSFRYVATGELAGGHRVLVATSGSCPARLLVFDSRDRLVYR